MMPLVFFMAPSDPRMISTIKAILENPTKGGLVSDGLVYRYPPQPRVDGLPGEEGTFNMCSFWLVEALTRAGQTNPGWLDEARLLFERMLNYANHLGLYAEQTSAQGRGSRQFSASVYPSRANQLPHSISIARWARGSAGSCIQTRSGVSNLKIETRHRFDGFRPLMGPS